MRHTLLAACVSTLVLIAARPAAAAELYGLVIGIDDYVGTVNDLQGAVNDARDVAKALEKAGGKVRLLTDAAATKARISSEWRSLVATTQAGDTLVFSFAGHGSQEPEPPGRGGEADGKNENFLLGGYQPTGPGVGERIVDDEMYEWLTMADQKGIKVIFIADSCHSGTMFRSVRGPKLRYRNGNFGDPDLATDVLKLPDPKFAKVGEDDFQNVTFISATQDNMLTPELTIEGAQRGALSWAFSRAIEGAADTNGDGELSQLELLAYLVPTVARTAEDQQIPQVLPLKADDRPVLRALKGTPAPERLVKVEAAAEKPLVTVFVRGGGALPAVMGVKAAGEGEADLVWDRAAGTVDHRIGGRVAEGIGDRQIAAVLSKWAALAVIDSAIAAAPVTLALSSGNKVYPKGSTVTVTMKDAALPYLTLFNLPPDGKVEFLLPANQSERDADFRKIAFSLPLKVQDPPFGAEHLVAILTAEPATALHEALKTMNTPERSQGLAAALATILRGQQFQAGAIGLYTSGGG